MSEEELRERFSRNLARLRKEAGFTQAQLAEKLNYSDKSVSKWERGDGLPDFSVAVTLAELFGVKLDDLLGDAPKARSGNRRNRLITTLLALGLVWLTATVCHFFFRYIPHFPAWYFFLFAIPASAIVAVVFTKLWWPRWSVFLSVSALIWAAIATVIVTVPLPGIALIAVVGGVLQALTVLWFLRKK